MLGFTNYLYEYFALSKTKVPHRRQRRTVSLFKSFDVMTRHMFIGY